MPQSTESSSGPSRSNRPPPYRDIVNLAETDASPLAALPMPGDGGEPRRKRRLTESRILILGFAAIVAAGTVLLKLPWASNGAVPITWIDALFTATSAVTVTGLAVRVTGSDFSLFGQLVILLLLQVGGVGFIAFSVLLYRLIGRRITLQTRFVVQQSVGSGHLSGALNLALYVLGVTLLLEAIGAFMLWLRWRATLPDGRAAWFAVFHSVSSYCNAGFDLFSGTDYQPLFGYGRDPYSLLVMGILIVLGGFGITILYDLWTFPTDRKLDINTRFTLWLTLIFTALGTIFMLGDTEYHHALFNGVPIHERLSVALFTIVSARTAGITLFPLEMLTEASQMVVVLWMFIGGAPASMAGGITTSAFAVILFTVISTARGHGTTVAFHRTIPRETIAKAVAIATISVLVIVLVTLALVFNREGPIFTSGFEVVSAFSNTGYSLGLTSELSRLDRLLIAFTMFWGRLGPLTIIVALAQREHPSLVQYPEEAVILG